MYALIKKGKLDDTVVVKAVDENPISLLVVDTTMENQLGVITSREIATHLGSEGVMELRIGESALFTFFLNKVG